VKSASMLQGPGGCGLTGADHVSTERCLVDCEAKKWSRLDARIRLGTDPDNGPRRRKDEIIFYSKIGFPTTLGARVFIKTRVTVMIPRYVFSFGAMV
jgi:hypothetical protein